MDRLILPLMMYKESGSAAKGTKKKHLVVPTWNHLYQIRDSRKFLDSWALKHKEKIEILTRQWMLENDWETTHDKKVYVDVWIFWSDARERDCHNIDKIIMDAFEDAGIYDNDCNALVRYQDFDIDMQNPRVEVEFTVGSRFVRKEKVEEQKKQKKLEEKRRKSL
ncbi:RusA family crossover junction endodeoxyribonuclease [Bacillus thuringiensis]|uniref:RusA family crossover junction endodeoxyribonuclease n=1 Tax=Bacillus thuringiensis TaxID=1428 RepID=UPI0021D6653E|nr:RusA family crossover junction endodeoxyribonuclease [Bacillus thuringiensis]MCU7666932.1 RusA family crossover junction endodeoxyribonuclease [Bacillus thuringiensis]